MLEGKYCCRYENSALLSVGNTLEYGTKSNLCLAEAYISAKKSVHRSTSFHILLDFVYGYELVLGLFKLEATLKVILHINIGREGKALGIHSRTVKLCQLLSHILNCRLYLRAGILPLVGAESVKLYSLIRILG